MIINDNFALESVQLAKRFKLPVLECCLVDREGQTITRFQGHNAVRNAILASKRVLKVGAFLAKRKSLHLIVISKKLPLDLKRLANVKDDTEFEKYVDVFAEKFKWNCSGPCMLQALELIAEQRIGFRMNSIYIKENKRWKKGFYNMATNSIEKY